MSIFAGWRWPENSTRVSALRGLQNCVAVGAIIGALLISTTACGTARQKARANYAPEEKAFVLIDQGKIFTRTGSPRLALERFDRAARIYSSPVAYFEMGRLFETQGETQKAATAYQDAIKLAPDYQEPEFAMLALGYTPANYKPTDNDIALARQWAAEHAAEIKANMATTSTLARDKTDAELQAEAAAAAAHRLPTQAEVRAALFSPQSEPIAAPRPSENPQSDVDRNIVLGTYEYHYAKAEQMRDHGQLEQAAQEYETAIVADPKRLEARLALGDMMLKAERYPRAQFYYQRSIEDFPQSAEPLFKMGTYYLTIHQDAQARDYFNKALVIDPNYVKPYNNLAFMAMNAKNYPEAARLLDHVIEIDPNYANAYLNRGIIAGDVDHDNAKALQMYQKYVDLGGERATQVKQWITELQSRGQ